MKNFSTLTKISLGILLAWGGIAQAEVAGRVLVAVGDTSAMRAGKEIKLAAGTPIETGDTLRVGDASNLQVRFTDEAIMALRPNTAMRIDTYAFTNKSDADKSIFSLLKGGLRTITGVIGRNSRDNYAVKAETATIGIRGTHFNIVQCVNDCRNPDGTLGPNGTFGGVTDGRIAVSNDAGQREFGKNEFFHVAAKDALPAALIAPPPFLRDRLDGQAKTRSEGKGKAATAEGGLSGGSATTTAASTQPASTAQPMMPVLTQTTYVPAEVPVLARSTGIEWNYSWAEATSWHDTSSYGGGYGSLADAWKEYLKVSSGALGSSISEENAVFSAFAGTPMDFAKTALSLSFTDYYGNRVSFSKSAGVDMGSNAAAGNLYWGRFDVTWTDSYGISHDYNHWGIGDPVTAMPTSGAFYFDHIGGTRPTDQYGNAGTITSGGRWVVDFGSQYLMTANAVTWTMPSGSNYTLNGSGMLPAGSTYSYQDQYVTYNGTAYGNVPITVTCSGGPCGGSVSGSAAVAPGFTGSSAQGMALGIATNLAGEATASVQAYKKGTSYAP